ncbi:AAA family ATPase [Pseudonocardia sp.]|uniref:AAA family ATPase n=1 Tax=Pseudonocardia sp. TaxID=60912 RepID=UPI003D097B22
MSTTPRGLSAERLAGREQELAELARRAGGCVAVVGEAGIGKSALVRAALAGRPAVAVGAATRPPAPPLRPLVELALAAVRLGADPYSSTLRTHRRVLGALLPGLVDRRVGSRVDGDPDGPAHPVVLADTLARLLDLVPGEPVLVLEDLHWADAETLDAVECLVARGHRRTVLTLRPGGPAHERVGRLADQRAVAVVALGPLPAGAVPDLLAALLDCAGPALPDALRAAADRAGGHPLWIEEIVATLRADGSLRLVDGRWVCDADRDVVPATLADSVAAQLDHLGPARPVLEAVALLGPAPLLSPASTAAALRLPEQAVLAALRGGAGSGLLTGGGAFRHELLRQAVLDAIPPARARELAGALLDLLAADPEPGDLDAVAALALRARRPATAAELLGRAARRDLGRGLPATAARTLRDALAVAPPQQRVALRELRVLADALAGDADAALADADAVDAELARLPGTADRRRALGEAVVRATAGQGRWADAAARVATLRAAFPTAASTAALAALVALERGDLAAAEAAAEAVLAGPAAPDGSGTVGPAARCEAMEVLGRLARRGDLATAQAWFQRAVVTAEDGGLALWRARALHELATVAQLRSLDLEPMGRARQAAVEAGAPGLVTAVDLQLAAVHGVRFEPDLALPRARAMLDAARRLGARRQEAFAWVLVGQAHAVAGRGAEAATAAAEARRLAPDDPEIEGLVRTVCEGLTALLADDVARATTLWRDGIAALRRVGEVRPYPPWFLWPLLATLGDADTDTDTDTDGGRAARAETDVPELRVVPVADALRALAEAVALGRLGDRGGADAAWARAEARLAEAPAAAGWGHLARRLAAPAALADGWGDPAGWTVQAGEWAQAHGHGGLARACRVLAARAGVRQRRAGRGDAVVPGHLARLGVTSREMDVLLLVARGMTNKEVAQQLHLAPRTVKGHVEQLLAKTGAANRTQLAGRLAP